MPHTVPVTPTDHTHFVAVYTTATTATTAVATAVFDARSEPGRHLPQLHMVQCSCARHHTTEQAHVICARGCEAQHWQDHSHYHTAAAGAVLLRYSDLSSVA
jgi:hypothetical protein